MKIERRSGGSLAWMLSFGAGVCAVASLAAAERTGGFALVPEMEVPPGIQAASPAERRQLESEAGGAEAIAVLEQVVRLRWRELGEVDLVALSRWDREVTRGSELPKRPGVLTGRVIGRDTSTGTWFVELRGPELPAELGIVRRWVTFYAGVRFSIGNEPVVVAPAMTIRREVRE